MQSYKTDVAVLILFFNRPDHLGKVFDEVRKARPSKLFLYQDGPRGERDMPGIEACRRIVENIDWECDVQRLYQERNYGCDPSEYISQKWAFSFVDKCIVLEDDDVPSQSFFTFCKEMLDRYEHDERIWMIAASTPRSSCPTTPTTISSPPCSLSGDGRRGAASSTSGNPVTRSSTTARRCDNSGR